VGATTAVQGSDVRDHGIQLQERAGFTPAIYVRLRPSLNAASTSPTVSKMLPMSDAPRISTFRKNDASPEESNANRNPVWTPTRTNTAKLPQNGPIRQLLITSEKCVPRPDAYTEAKTENANDEGRATNERWNNLVGHTLGTSKSPSKSSQFRIAEELCKVKQFVFCGFLSEMATETSTNRELTIAKRIDPRPSESGDFSKPCIRRQLVEDIIDFGCRAARYAVCDPELPPKRFR
jgi:hypothetical protein